MATTYIRSYEHENQAIVFRNIYGWMTMALLISALASLVSLKWIETSVTYSNFLLGGSGMWLLFGISIVLVLVLAGRLQRLSFGAATGLFITYAVVTGMALAPIFLIYTQTSIVYTFLITAGTFGAMSLYGFITKANLSTIGHLCAMALIGLILATVVNLFLKSDTMGYVLSYVGIVLFCGLTAYDTQKYKQLLKSYDSELTDEVRKLALLGAFELYLDFLNLFLYLLRVLGRRN
jgi:FtsH-binding integral membrane protein